MKSPKRMPSAYVGSHRFEIPRPAGGRVDARRSGHGEPARFSPALLLPMDHCRTARAVPAHRVRGRGSGLPATRQRGRRVMRASEGATARSLGIAAALCLALLAGGVSPAAADPLPPGPTSPAPPPDPIDAYAPYNPQSTCDPTVKPGTQYVLDMVISYYGVGRRSSTSRACSVAGTSEHARLVEDLRPTP